MSVQDDQLNIVELLAQHEEALSALYRTYADKFIDYEQFWEGLVQDELKHAQWIRAVKPKVEEGSVIVNEDRFPAAGIQESIQHIKNLNNKAEELDITLEEALQTAAKLEKGLIDLKFFEAFEGDPEALKNLLSSLKSATQYHYQMVYETWTKVRDSGQ